MTTEETPSEFISELIEASRERAAQLRAQEELEKMTPEERRAQAAEKFAAYIENKLNNPEGNPLEPTQNN